jgi:hypothetical protein
LKSIGFELGKSFDLEKADPLVNKALDGVPEAAQKLEGSNARQSGERLVNETDTMGVYGNYYLKRAIIAQLGLGANLPEDAIYPLNLGDESGKPLDGANKYPIHFDNWQRSKDFGERRHYSLALRGPERSLDSPSFLSCTHR